MADNISIVTRATRHPFSFAVLVLSLVILLVWFDQRQPSEQSGQVDSLSSEVNSVIDEPMVLSAPSTAASGRTQPKVLDSLSETNQRQASAAGAIGDLVGRLEEKVKADPKNAANRLLLGQTYKELGQLDEAVKLLQGLHKEEPDNNRVNLVLASIFSQSDNPQEVAQALQLLNKLSSDQNVPEYTIHMYKGDALVRQNNNKEALSEWKAAMATMPEKDPFYRIVEQRVMELSAKESANP